MSKFKIAIIGTRGYPSYYGGFETAVRRIVDDSTATDFEYYIFSRRRDCEVNINLTNGHAIYVPSLKSKNLSTLSHILFSIPKLIILRPHAVLAFNVTCGYILPVTKLLRIPVVINVDGKSARKAFLLGAKITARFADQIISDSTNIALYWKRVFARDSVFIPYGGTLPEINNLNVYKKSNYLLYVARFVPENHFHEFLESLKYLDESIPVIIVGTSNGDLDIDAKIRVVTTLRSNILAVGAVKDDGYLAKLWAEAGLYFHGHSVGGTNPALVQAMASGAPIVAFDSIFNREVLSDAGLYTKCDPRDMAKLFNSLMSKPAGLHELGKKAQKRAMTNYTWPSIILSYENLLRKWIGKKDAESTSVR